MKVWGYAGLFLAAYVIQTSLFGSSLALWGVRPDLMLVLIVAIALRHGPVEGACCGFAAGLFTDLVGGYLIGLGALVKAIAGAGVGWLGQALFGSNALVPAAAALAASLVEHVLYLAGTWTFGVEYPFAESLQRVVLPGVWYDTLAAVVLVPALAPLVRAVGAPGAGEVGPNIE